MFIIVYIQCYFVEFRQYTIVLYVLLLATDIGELKMYINKQTNSIQTENDEQLNGDEKQSGISSSLLRIIF